MPTPNTRTEKDSIGTKEIPADAYYGVQTVRAVENYPISGMRAHPVLIRAIAMVKRAAAEANKSLGLVDAKRADAIMQAAQEVIDGKWNHQFVVDVFQAGAGVSFHMNSNEVIANRAVEILGGKLGDYSIVHPNDHVNYGQSTNDVFPTSMRLATLLELEKLYPALEGLAGALEAKGKEFHNIMKSGRTHMQDAVPMRLGQEFAAYGMAIRKAVADIRQAADSLRELGLGGSAVGTGINTHPDYRAKAVANLSRISGQKLTPAADMRWAMQSNAGMAQVSAALRNLALEIIRLSHDLRLLASGPNTGLAEINLPGLQPGSSIMPGKINPVMPELAAMVSFQVIGNDTAVAFAVQGGQLELNVMMPTMAYSVLQSITILTNMVKVFTEKCIAGLTANAKRCDFYAQSTVSLATALNPYIGYAKAAEIVKESVATGRSIIDIARDKKLLTEQEIAEILDPVNMTEPQVPQEAAKKREEIKAKETSKAGEPKNENDKKKNAGSKDKKKKK
ncbi:MAG TPA: aspartate ammonia-lyase [Candidatus Angelobacter sp.]|nr:aspartate ammonia-lyase [Candidatus Angelobacter sp.]